MYGSAPISLGQCCSNPYSAFTSSGRHLDLPDPTNASNYLFPWPPLTIVPSQLGKHCVMLGSYLHPQETCSMSVKTISAHQFSTPKAILAPASKSAHKRRNKDIYNWLLTRSKGWNWTTKIMAEFKSFWFVWRVWSNCERSSLTEIKACPAHRLKKKNQRCP